MRLSPLVGTRLRVMAVKVEAEQYGCIEKTLITVRIFSLHLKPLTLLWMAYRMLPYWSLSVLQEA